MGNNSKLLKDMQIYKFRSAMGKAKTAMKDVIDMNVKSSSDLFLESRVAMLNANQRRIFDYVKSHLLHQQQHAEK